MCLRGSMLNTRTRLVVEARPLLRWLAVPLLTSSLFISASCSRAQNSGPERDRWQRPDEVMDALGVRAGSVVADVGCGKGYFSIKLAQRVGPTGKVYAEDIQEDVLEDVRHEAEKEGLKQIETILGAPDDPRLPAGSLDVVLAVNSYHEWVQYDAMLAHLYAALKPGGLLGLIDRPGEPGQSRESYHQEHRMPESMERDDATRQGFRFVLEAQGFTRTSDGDKFYFLIFSK
jgi:predicted methyltransferase